MAEKQDSMVVAGTIVTGLLADTFGHRYPTALP